MSNRGYTILGKHGGGHCHHGGGWSGGWGYPAGYVLQPPILDVDFPTIDDGSAAADMEALAEMVAEKLAAKQREQVAAVFGDVCADPTAQAMDEGGPEEILGYWTPPVFGTTVDSKLAKAYLPISVSDATHAMEQAYAVLEEARAIAKGRKGLWTGNWPWEVDKNLGVDATIANKLGQVNAFTQQLRGVPAKEQGRAVTRDEWERVRNFINTAAAMHAGVNEGRKYQTEVFNQFLDEVRQGVADAPKSILAQVPWWAWVAGGGALLVVGVVAVLPYALPLLSMRTGRRVTVPTTDGPHSFTIKH